ncbi:tRNA-guanine(15) transglycosylase-like protein [Microdochium trichocladiopsis]|uniref:Queuine tRNA-ribosyltransferase accessory subunit 2 n=1 Tax=Microdochium trichocladiopsis TaxID=1682393 RepID=A0A9P8YCJ4_9PEZI|nr:tRNA-guanine(15) transglycosylase-like protein [Microdochium trichocladiopsis]KAH7033593.1 tRNA-guanine(15) transglycosylase-like protein [Microdochium trichocladiopsis]
MLFEILKNVKLDHGAARVGRLALPRQRARLPIDTPNFIAITSRGSVPHMTPDVVTRHTQLAGAYMALEDFVELSQKRKSPALYKASAVLNGGLNQTSSPPSETDTSSTSTSSKGALHFYTATPPSQTIVLAARRHPAVTAPMGNGVDYVSLFTSTGFQKLKVDDYCDAVADVRPDVAVPLADLTYGYAEAGNRLANPKRQLRMVERTEDWVANFFARCTGGAGGGAAGAGKKVLDNTAVFAPTLPVPYSMQWDYLNRLSQDHREHISGLAIYDADILADLGDYPALTPLPRMSMDFFMSPHNILRQVQLGMDLFTVPFINTASDAGIAMTFQFLPPAGDNTGTGVMPLGIDMWSETHRVAVKPLLEGCTCYVCTKHHRAFLQHLLNAKEMLGWTLLQIHNHHIVSQFFADIRKVLSEESPETFDDYCRQFQLRYDSELPKGTGERPRARGYHFKAEAGQAKINKPAWEKFEASDSQLNAGLERVSAKGQVGSVATGAALEGTETPVVPEGTASELVEKGFAEVDSGKT